MESISNTSWVCMTNSETVKSVVWWFAWDIADLLEFQNVQDSNTNLFPVLEENAVRITWNYSFRRHSIDSPSRLLLRCKYVKKPDNWERGSYSDGFLLNRITHQNLGLTSHSKCRKSRVRYGCSSSHAKITTNIKIETSMNFFETGVSCRSCLFETGVWRRSIFLRPEFTPIDLFERQWQSMSAWEELITIPELWVMGRSKSSLPTRPIGTLADRYLRRWAGTNDCDKAADGEIQF
jgi:hypothetical protein